MDVVYQAAVTGLLQGLTEFIPVSSSAHLELAPWIFGWQEDELIGSLAFDVFLHLGTLVALLAYFGRDWVRYIGAALGSLRDYLPTRFSSAWADLLASPVDWADLASGVFSGLAYATVFGLAAWWRFATKDITS